MSNYQSIPDRSVSDDLIWFGCDQKFTMISWPTVTTLISPTIMNTTEHLLCAQICFAGWQSSCIGWMSLDDEANCMLAWVHVLSGGLYIQVFLTKDQKGRAKRWYHSEQNLEWHKAVIIRIRQHSAKKHSEQNKEQTQLWAEQDSKLKCRLIHRWELGTSICVPVFNCFGEWVLYTP